MPRKLSSISPDWWDYTTLDADLIAAAARLTPRDLERLARPGFRVVMYDTLEDFYCAEARLVLETDGFGHGFPDQQRHDAKRDEFLRSQGILVKRIWNWQLRRQLEWVRYNIQVNAVQPGYFETPMNTHFFASKSGQKVIKKNIPANRLGQLEDMKGLAVYLASPASNFMTGSCIIIDGGQVCW